MQRWLLVAVLAASTAHAQSGSGPLPPEASVLPAEGLLLGADLKALFASATWRQLSQGELRGPLAALPKEQADKTRSEMKEGIAKGLAEAEQKLGLRPDRDLDRLAMVVGGFAGKEPSMALVAVGRFDPARIAAALEESQKAAGTKAAHRTVGGTRVLAWEKDGKPDFAVTVDSGTLLFGSTALVERALANRSKRFDALLASPSLRALVGGLRPDAGFWIVADEAALEKVRPAGATPPPFPLPRSLTLAAQFDGGLEIAGQMADEAAAKNLADVIRGGLALGRMQAEQKAPTPERAQAQQAFLEVLSSIEIEQQGRTLRISSSAAGGGTAGVGVLAAIAIPSLLRARVSANEAAAIGDVRTVISAQAAYSSANRGRYGELRCLEEPKGCAPGYTGPAFLDASLASLSDKSGYKRAFFPGKPSKPGARTYAAFAYTATPVEPGKTGVRSFCGDSTGIVCADPKGAAIQPDAGACPSTCAPLQ